MTIRDLMLVSGLWSYLRVYLGRIERQRDKTMDIVTIELREALYDTCPKKNFEP